MERTSVSILETTVGTLHGVRVGVGNLGDNRYRLPDGSEQEGMAAQFFVEDERPFIAGVGSVIQVGDHAWEVSAISKTPGKRGTVTLHEVEDAP